MEVLVLFIHFILFYAADLFAAQPYKLIAFENSYYRDYSFDELSHLLGTNASYLPYFSCKDKNLKKIFFKPPRKNPKKDSLKIQLHQSQEVVTYKRGRFLDNQGKENPDMLNNLFIKHARIALAKIESTSQGSLLLRLLEESFFPITITLGANSFSPNAGGIRRGGLYMSEAIVIFDRLRKADDSLPFENIGHGGLVYWSPSEPVESLEEDGVLRPSPPEIVLAHELYHAFDSIRGLLDSRIVISPNTLSPAGHAKYDQPVLIQNPSDDKAIHGPAATVAEYRAVYFENLIRSSLSLKLRKSYSKTGDDDIPMLTSNKKPVLIPAPCLNY